jgi:hypothetical protein
MARLKGLNIADACQDGADYFNSFDTPEDFVKNCDRGDWLLWLFARTNPDDIRRLTLAKAFCSETVVHLMKDKRSIDAVNVAIGFGLGFATEEELKEAASDAYYAAQEQSYFASNAIYYASSVAAYCAVSADAAAAAVAYYAANTDTNNDSIKKNRQLTADICRKFLPIEIWNFGGCDG